MVHIAIDLLKLEHNSHKICGKEPSGKQQKKLIMESQITESLLEVQNIQSLQILTLLHLPGSVHLSKS